MSHTTSSTPVPMPKEREAMLNKVLSHKTDVPIVNKGQNKIPGWGLGDYAKFGIDTKKINTTMNGGKSHRKKSNKRRKKNKKSRKNRKNKK